MFSLCGKCGFRPFEISPHGYTGRIKNQFLLETKNILYLQDYLEKYESSRNKSNLVEMIQWKLKKEVGQIYYWEPSQTKDTSDSSGFEKSVIKPPVPEEILINVALKVSWMMV